jgi:disulfide oxidoreductase YuzD
MDQPIAEEATAVIGGTLVDNISQPITEEAAAESAEPVLSNGIYQLTNVYVASIHSSYGTFYLRGENGTVELSTNTYGDTLDNLYRYWYFDYQGNNQYLIRNMGEYSKALSVSGGDAVLTSASSASLWTLSASSYGGYQLRCASNTSNDLLSAITSPVPQPPPPTNPSYHYNTVDVSVGAVADMAFDSWNISPVGINGLYFQKTSNGKLYDTFSKTYHINNSSVSLSSMGYSVKAISSVSGLITPYSVSWTSSNSSVATVNSSGTVTLRGSGQTTITASATVNGTTKSASYTLNVEIPTKYIQFSYDMGYVNANRIGSEAVSVTRARIENAIRDDYFAPVAIAFAERCNINLSISSISNYTSDADTCPNPDDDGHCGCITDEQCLLKWFDDPSANNSTNGFEHAVHCRSFTRLRNNLITGLPSNTIRVTYSGYDLCFYHPNDSDGLDHEYDIAGLADYDAPIICIDDSLIGSSRNPLVLAHEITHTFDIQHHARVAGQPCIMDEDRYNGIDANNPATYWCDSCENSIRNHI